MSDKQKGDRTLGGTLARNVHRRKRNTLRDIPQFSEETAKSVETAIRKLAKDINPDVIKDLWGQLNSIRARARTVWPPDSLGVRVAHSDSKRLVRNLGKVADEIAKSSGTLRQIMKFAGASTADIIADGELDRLCPAVSVELDSEHERSNDLSSDLNSTIVMFEDGMLEDDISVKIRHTFYVDHGHEVLVAVLRFIADEIDNSRQFSGLKKGPPNDFMKIG